MGVGEGEPAALTAARTLSDKPSLEKGIKPRIGTVRSLAAPDDGTTTKGARGRTVECYLGRTVGRNIVLRRPKSILLHCNKLNRDLIFSCLPRKNCPRNKDIRDCLNHGYNRAMASVL